MLADVQKEIDAFYGKYAEKEGITISEAKKRASQLDMDAYSAKAKKYVKEHDFSDEANEEMRLYNMTMKVNRLEMLKANIGTHLVGGFDEMEKLFGEKLTDRAIDEFERQAGILGDTVQDNNKKAASIVNASFHNATYSERVWMHQDLLKAEIAKNLRTGLIQGKNPRVLAQDIRRTFGSSRYNAERLMRTEMARVQTDAQMQSFKENGFGEYQFLALGNACEICRALDGKHFPVDKMMPGLNAPPMHPNCRCSTSAYMDRKEFDQWLDGKSKGSATEEWNKLKNTGKASTNTNKSGIINKAKDLGLFPLINLPSDSQKIRPNTILKELKNSSKGQKALAYLENNNIIVGLNYGPAEKGVRASQQGEIFKLNVENLKSDKDAAAAVVHEITHHKYNIGGTQKAEVICFMEEYKFLKGVDKVSRSVVKRIIRGVKEQYGSYDWK